MNDFYVYGLLDPRTNSLFYIGKGRDNRINQHFNNKAKSDGNNEKINVINEIQNANLNVKKIQIGKNLSEEAAYILERILIYRIGRKILDEGTLTNIQPGGLFTTGDKYFLDNDDIPNEKIIELKYPELLPILEFYPHTAINFNPSNLSNNSGIKFIYMYRKGTLSLYDFNEFFRLFDLRTSLKIINILKSTSMPLFFCNSIISKSKLEFDNDIFFKIKFQENDIINFDFVEKVNKSIAKGEIIKIECFYPNGNIHIVMELLNNQSILTYYYENKQIKYTSTNSYNRLNDGFKSWYDNGVLKSEILYNKNGNIETYKSWYDNGKIEHEVLREPDGSVMLKNIEPIKKSDQFILDF
jgi:antitoxin component YwqK of YwqJK toxin-antitoxin module